MREEKTARELLVEFAKEFSEAVLKSLELKLSHMLYIEVKENEV